MWCGRISKDTEYIEGLDEMMTYHNIKEYHVCFIKYIGGSDFVIEVFNPYYVSIDYMHNNILESNQSEIPLEVGTDEFRRNLEVAKFFETFRYNAYYNCEEICRFHVNRQHLGGGPYTEVDTSG